MGQFGDYQNNEGQTHHPDKDLAQTLNRLEDRLIMVSLPVLVGAFILWGLAGAYPANAAPLNVSTSTLVLLVSCVVAVRLSEVGWEWAEKSVDFDPFPFMGTLLLSILALLGVAGVVTMMMQASQATDARTVLMGSLVIILVLLYREIIVRYTRKEKKTDE